MRVMVSKHALAVLCAALLAACAALKTAKIPETHPEEVTGSAVCSSCHDRNDGFSFSSYDHRGDWLGAHRLRAQENAPVCAMCHAASFCADCHAQPSEMTPAERRQSEVQRDLPHRGDYRSRHRVEARLDPASCFRCHGNPRASKLCVSCHGK